MEALFDRNLAVIWVLALTIALFLPVRKLIWILQVRRAERTAPIEEPERERLRRRAGFTAALLCFVFSALYVNHLFSD
ncbi:MAG: hypothetical protein HKM95_02925 [Inquilinus sp.]|nr:hypothetical protein [Inquilinus sp.]